MSIKVRYLDNPFTGHASDREVEPGLTYEQIVDAGDYTSIVSHVAVKVDDEDVADLSAEPPDGAIVTVYGIPAGGSMSDEEKTDKGKSLAGFGQLANFLGTILLFTPFAPIGIAMIAVGTIMTIAGGLYYASGMKGKMEDALRSRDSPERLPGVRGSRNQLRPYSDVPILYGTHHLVPPLASKPYTELNGDDQYLRQLFMIGYGDIDVTDIRVAENAIANYEEFDYEIAKPGETTSLYSDTVVESEIGAELEPGVEIVRTTESDGSELSVDIVFPRGLGAYNNDGDKESFSVRIQGWYRVQGATDWQTFFDDTWSSKAMETIRRTKRTTVAKDVYEVKLKRVIEHSFYEGQIVDDSQWGVLRIVDPQDPVSAEMRDRTTRLAVRARASGQFRGIIDKLSCTGNVSMPVYSGTGSGAGSWNYSHGHTSNPASAYLFTLQGPGAKRTVPDSKIDWAALEAWYNTCETKGYKTNAYDADSQTLADQLQVIASVGHAFVVKNGGAFGVSEDQPKEPIQHFTPKNSWGFSAVKSFAEPATALNVTFIDADAGYKQVEMRVYYDEDNPSDAVVDDTELWGITGEDQAWRYGRRELYQTALRRTRFSLNADFEALRCRRGDWVRVTHDVALLGITSGRIVEVIRNDNNEVVAIELDEPVTMETGTDYAIRIRTADDDDYLIQLDNANATVYTVNVLTADVGVYNIDVGDLYGTREMGQLTDTYMITSVVPENDFAAKLSLEPTEQAIFDAETGAAPAFDARVTLVADDNARPPTPTISLRADGTTIKKKSDGTWENRIAVDIYGNSGLGNVYQNEVQWRVFGSNDTWNSVFADPETVEVTITNVDALETYSVRARALAEDSASSNWAEDSVQVLGKFAPPNNVATLTHNIRPGEGIQLSWSRIADKDFAYFIVRNGSDWDTANTIFEGDATTFLWENLQAGEYTVQVRAVDTTGNISTASATETFEIVAPGPVTELSVTMLVDGVQLIWNPPDDPSSGEALPIDYYIVSRDGLNDLDYDGGSPTTTSYDDDLKGSAPATSSYDVDLEGGSHWPEKILYEGNSQYARLDELDLGEFRYSVTAYDVAGNKGKTLSINNNVEEITSRASDIDLTTPVLSTRRFLGDIYVLADQQNNVRRYGYDVQVAESSDGPWYRPKHDGDDWKEPGSEDGFEHFDGEVWVHSDVPHDGTSDEPTARTLYYRMRRVRTDDNTIASAWSDPVSASTRPVGEADIEAESIKAGKLFVTNLEAISADMGTLTAGKIEAPVSPEHFKIDLTNRTFKLGDTTGEKFIELDSDGNMTFKLITFRVSSLDTRIKSKLSISDSGDLDTGLDAPLELSADGVGNATIGVDGTSVINLDTSGVDVTGSLDVGGDVSITGSLDVGTVDITGSLDVGGDVSITGSILGDNTIGGSLDVGGDIKSNGKIAATVSTDTTTDKTSFPVGHIILVFQLNEPYPNRNSSRTIYLWGSGSYTIDPSFGGDSLAGTWVSRGRIMAEYNCILMQRIS